MSQSSHLAALIVPLLALSAGAALRPPAHPLFDGDAVHEIELTFAQPDWWEQLVANYEDVDQPDILASFSWEGVQLDSIGVRFKGNSSYYNYSGLKKSFKLDLDTYVSGQEIDGLDKLNLNNAFLDPSFVRERCAYEVCEAAGLPTVRTNYAALTINGEYWGLYILVEQLDQEFLESRFGSGEEGNLWKGEPHGSLEWLGTDEADYHDDYELKTNEELDDWSALVDLVDVLNNESLAALRDSLHNRMDVNSALAMLAVDNLMVNLDSYIGRCANYYLYHRDLDSRFVFAKWDLNEAWGVFNFNLQPTQLRQLDPHWTNPQFGEDRPLAERLWQIPEFDDVYLGHFRKLMAGVAQPDTLLARMEALHDLVRPWALSDPNMMFTDAQFEAAIDSDVYASGGPPPGRLIPGLRPFIEARDDWLTAQIGSWTPIEGLVLNEVMASNASTVADEYGEYEDWVELLNTGAAPVALGGLGLTDHMEGTADFVLPDTVLAPGARLLVWADEEPEQGPLHAPFKLDADGEDLHLTDGAVTIEQLSWPALGSDVAWGRWPDGTGEWRLLAPATPGSENQAGGGGEVPMLFVNEFLASNDSGLQDETGTCEDWLELYNPGLESVDLGGLFLTDDFTQPTQWMLPDTTLPARGHLVVWCDDDADDGPLHATFKLGAGGEAIGLFASLAGGNGLIDGVEFSAQETDVSQGRSVDGGAEWVFFAIPTPGAPNAGLGTVTDLSIAYAAGRVVLSWSPQSGATGYRVWTADAPWAAWPSGWTLLAAGLSEPEWEGGVLPGVSCYRVQCMAE